MNSVSLDHWLVCCERDCWCNEELLIVLYTVVLDEKNKAADERWGTRLDSMGERDFGQTKTNDGERDWWGTRFWTILNGTTDERWGTRLERYLNDDEDDDI